MLEGELIIDWFYFYCNYVSVFRSWHEPVEYKSHASFLELACWGNNFIKPDTKCDELNELFCSTFLDGLRPTPWRKCKIVKCCHQLLIVQFQLYWLPIDRSQLCPSLILRLELLRFYKRSCIHSHSWLGLAFCCNQHFSCLHLRLALNLLSRDSLSI